MKLIKVNKKYSVKMFSNKNIKDLILRFATLIEIYSIEQFIWLWSLSKIDIKGTVLTHHLLSKKFAQNCRCFSFLYMYIRITCSKGRYTQLSLIPTINNPNFSVIQIYHVVPRKALYRYFELIEYIFIHLIIPMKKSVLSIDSLIWTCRN